MSSSLTALEYNKLISFIWSVADDCLRDVYVRGKYRDVIIPMTIIRRFDAVIEPHKETIKLFKKLAEENGTPVENYFKSIEFPVPFYNTSEFSLKDLLCSTNAQNLKQNFTEYLNGFSSNVREILEKFDFYTQINKMTEANILGLVIEKFISPEFNLSTEDKLNANGEIIHKGLDNHAMGTLFEEIIRKFNEENNEEAGEHFTPRDVVELMADLAIYPIIDKIKDNTYTIYDGACGTFGMGTVAEERLQQLAAQHGKTVSIHLIGQEVNAETYAISKADLLLKGGDANANHVYYGSTISNDQTAGQTFDFMLSNPPYGKSWKNDLAELGIGVNKDPSKNVSDPRFVIGRYKEQEDFRMLPNTNDGQMLFLLNNIAKMKNTELGSRILEVHNGSPLFQGDAGNGNTNARRYMIENDLIEAIIQLPGSMFYNTSIPTYIWVLTNRKEERRKGKIQLINTENLKTSLNKSMGSKRNEFSPEDREFIRDLYMKFEDNEYSKILSNEEFGYYQITVDRPLRQAVVCNEEQVATIEAELEKVGFFTEQLNKEALKDSFIKSTASALKELSTHANLQAYLGTLKTLARAERERERERERETARLCCI